MKIKWKDIVGYEGIYEISNTGEVRTKEGKVTYTKRHGERVWQQRILKLKIDRNGYKRVSLWKYGEHRDWLVHRLVAINFISNPNCYPMINHIDGISSNNDTSNLQWCDSKMNNNHAFDNRLIKTGKQIIAYSNGKEIHFRSISKTVKTIGVSQNKLIKLLLNGDRYKSKDGNIYTFRFKA